MPSPQERGGDRITAHGPCTGMGNCGGLSPILPRHTPCHPIRCHILVEDGIRRPLSPWGCYCEFRACHLVPSPSLPFGHVAKEKLSPWHQRQRTGLPSAQSPSSDWSTRPCPSRPLMSPWQPGFHLSAQKAGDSCLSTGLLFVPRQALLLPERFPAPRLKAPSLLLGRRAALNHSWLLSQSEGMLGQRVFRSMRASSTELQRQAAAASPNATLISQGTLCFPRGDALAKRLSLYAGFSNRVTGLRQAAAARRTFLSECCAFAEALAWSEQHFAAASSARFQSRQGRRAAGELVPLGPCFPRLHDRFLGSP